MMRLYVVCLLKQEWGLKNLSRKRMLTLSRVGTNGLLRLLVSVSCLLVLMSSRSSKDEVLDLDSASSRGSTVTFVHCFCSDAQQNPMLKYAKNSKSESLLSHVTI